MFRPKKITRAALGLLGTFSMSDPVDGFDLCKVTSHLAEDSRRGRKLSLYECYGVQVIQNIYKFVPKNIFVLFV